MRFFLIFLILTLSFQTLGSADDIRDFEIEGISIEDSLLEFYSETEIKKQLSRTSSTRKNTEFLRVYFDLTNPEIYSTINIHFKNDKSYEITSIGGIEYFNNDMDSCYSKQNKIVKDLDESFPNAKKNNFETSKHTSDPSGKSSVRDIWFNLNNGQIYVSCTDWGDNMTTKYNWMDNLGVYLDSSKHIDWLISLDN